MNEPDKNVRITYTAYRKIKVFAIKKRKSLKQVIEDYAKTLR